MTTTVLFFFFFSGMNRASTLIKFFTSFLMSAQRLSVGMCRGTAEVFRGLFTEAEVINAVLPAASQISLLCLSLFLLLLCLSVLPNPVPGRRLRSRRIRMQSAPCQGRRGD